MAAEFMPQAEIDEMLSQVNSSNELNTEVTDESMPSGETYRYYEKVIRYKTPPMGNFSSNYKSPIIKRNNVNFNPHLNGTSTVQENGLVEVYSLEEYQSLKK
jgi:hypothetical protein